MIPDLTILVTCLILAGATYGVFRLADRLSRPR
jgi:hypothetical protein